MANRVQLEAILKFVEVQANPGIFNNISRATAGLPGPVQQFNRNLTQSVSAANNVSRAVRGVREELTGSQRAAQLFLQRMAQFAILLPTFATLNRSIQGGVKFLFDFDAAIKDIIRVDIGKLSEKFDDIAAKAFKLSDAFGTSAVEAVNTIKLYVQAGFDLEKANELARVSLLATKASTLDAAGAVEFILSATKQFGLEGQALTRALDSLVAAEDLSALEAQDIADAFRTGGNSLAEFAKDIDDAIGLISGLREQTRKSGNEIGTFFKTLQTRIFAAGESRSAIEALGVTVQNLDGSLRPTLDVLNDVKIAFDGMTEAQQANAAKAIAGVRQFESLIGTLNSLERANELSAKSSEAAGAAQRKEEIDAQKLSRRLDELKNAADQLAFALGKAGATDFFKNTLVTVTTMVKALTLLVKLFDDIKVPILPILAPIALKGISSVFGLGGGVGGGGGAGRGGVGGGPGLAPALAQDADALRTHAFMANMVAERLRMVNAAMVRDTGALAAINRMKMIATNQEVFALNKLQVAHNMTANAAMKASLVYQKSIGSIQNSGARFAVQYALLTVGVSAMTAGLNALADKIGNNGPISGFLSELTKSTATTVQVGGQFAILGDTLKNKLQIGLISGLFATLAERIPIVIEAFEDNATAAKELAAEQIRQARLQSAPKALATGTEGLKFLQTLSQGVKGRTPQETDVDRIFKEALRNLDPATRAFIKNVDDLKQVLLDPATGKETLRLLSQLDSANIVNQEALDKLRASYDSTEKSTLSHAVGLDLLNEAYGQVNGEIDKATGLVKNLIHTFEDMQKLQQLIGFAQSVNNLGRELELASKAPADMIEGIDKLRFEANAAAEDLINAQRAFDALRKSLAVQESAKVGQAGFGVDAAEAFLNEFSAILDKPNNGAAIAEFLSKQTTEMRAFAEEFAKVDEDRRQSIINNLNATQSLEKEIYDNNREQLEAQREASFAAADGIANFKNELLELGAAGVDTSFIDDFAKLTSVDIGKILSGTSDISSVIQEVITNTFVDGVKKAEGNLKTIAEQTANSIHTVEIRIASLRSQIAELGDVQPDTKKGAEKQKLELKLTAELLNKENIARDGVKKSIEGARAVTVEYKKAQEEAARAEADRLKKTLALTNATYDFSKSIKDANRSFEEFLKQKIEDWAEKQATAYEELKSTQQEVLSATEGVDSAYHDFISTLLQVNGALVEAQIKANLFGREIGMLNGSVVTFQDKLSSLDSAFTDALDNANMSLEQRIQLETQLAEQTLSFLKQAQDEIVTAGLGIFGQSAQENQGLQEGLAGLSFIAEKLGGSFQSFLNLNPQELGTLSQELLNLPVEFKQSILDALAFLPSTTSIGGFSVEQLKQAIGQIGAGVAPEAGLPAISELTAQQVEQLKILGNLGQEDAKLQLSQLLAAQQSLEKAQEQLDVAKIQEERAREGFEFIRATILEEMVVIEEGNIDRRDLLHKVIEADNANTLHDIETQSQLFADQNTVFKDVGVEIVAGISQAINAKNAFLEAQTSLNNFNTIQDFGDNAKGFIPNFAGGNLNPREAAGLLHAAAREKKAMPHGARLAVANTHEAIIPMNRGFMPNFAEGNTISAAINSIRMIDQTMVAAIARSVSDTLSRITSDSGQGEALNKISDLLTELNASVDQVKDSNLAIKFNTAGATTTTTEARPTATSQEVKISLQTNQNNTVKITGLESLRDQLRIALTEVTDKQVQEQLELLMDQLDPLFQALNERGVISGLGQSR